MKSIRILLIVTSILMLGYNSNTGQVRNNYTIECKFIGLPNNSLVILRDQNADTILKSYSTNNKVIFRGKLEQDGQFLFIRFDSTIYNQSTKAIFVKNNSYIKVNGQIGLKEIEVKGTNEQAEYDSLLRKDREFGIEVNKILEEVNSIPVDTTGKTLETKNQSKFDSLFTLPQKMQNERSLRILQWASTNHTSLLVPYILMNIMELNYIEPIRNTFNNMNLNTQSSYYGKRLQKELQYANTYLLLEKNKQFPNLTVSDQNGNTYYIREIAMKNKLTLIDCWASWCSPCRSEIPKLKTLYDKYKDKGFEIIGISSDNNITSWQKAIKEDKTEWPHYIEFKNSPFSKMCGVEAIPTYILLDQSGNLLAFDSGMSIMGTIGDRLSSGNLGAIIERELNKNKH